jgi:hypothetical protein
VIRRAVLYAFLLPALLLAPALRAQHEHPPARPDTARARAAMGMSAGEHARMMAEMTGPLGIPVDRMGSGTSWLPDESIMPFVRFRAGEWSVMVHGVAFGQYQRQYGARGDDQLGSINWAMLMATRNLPRGRLQLRTMLTLEPWTVSGRGYPLLLQSGETFRGEPIHDRQHPHDLFMELGVLFERELTRDLGLSLYLAPSGEPAASPVAFMHRPSAQNDPIPPIGHHWQDATHITFGVVTAGLFTRRLKVEGSLFNGREPDEDRTDVELRALDSRAARLTFNPSSAWSLSASYAWIRSPEAHEPEEDMQRATASVLHGRALGKRGNWSSALVFGANRHHGGGFAPSLLLESNLEPDRRNAFFGRAEVVRKTAEDLVLEGFPEERAFTVGSVALGYVRELVRLPKATLGAGVRGSINLLPGALEPAYGSRTPAGLTVFVRLKPVGESMRGMGQMEM